MIKINKDKLIGALLTTFMAFCIIATVGGIGYTAYILFIVYPIPIGIGLFILFLVFIAAYNGRL